MLTNLLLVLFLVTVMLLLLERIRSIRSIVSKVIINTSFCTIILYSVILLELLDQKPIVLFDLYKPNIAGALFSIVFYGMVFVVHMFVLKNCQREQYDRLLFDLKNQTK